MSNSAVGASMGAGLSATLTRTRAKETQAPSTTKPAGVRTEGSTQAEPRPTRAAVDSQRSADARRAFAVAGVATQATLQASLDTTPKAAVTVGTGVGLPPPSPQQLRDLYEAGKEKLVGVVKGAKDAIESVIGVSEPVTKERLESLKEGEKIIIGMKGTDVVQVPRLRGARLGGQVEAGTEIEKKDGKYVLHSTLGTEAVGDAADGDIKGQGGVKVKNEYTFNTEEEALEASEALARQKATMALAEVRMLTPAEKAQREADARLLERYRTATELSGAGALELAKAAKVIGPVELERSRKDQGDVTVRIEKDPAVAEVRFATSTERKLTPQVDAGPVSVNLGGASAKVTTTKVVRMPIPEGIDKEALSKDPLGTLTTNAAEMVREAKTETRVKLEAQDPTGRVGTDVEVILRPTGDTNRDAELLKKAEEGDLEGLRRAPTAGPSPVEFKAEVWRKEGSIIRYNVDIDVFEQELEVENVNRRIVSRSEYPVRSP